MASPKMTFSDLKTAVAHAKQSTVGATLLLCTTGTDNSEIMKINPVFVMDSDVRTDTDDDHLYYVCVWQDSTNRLRMAGYIKHRQLLSIKSHAFYRKNGSFFRLDLSKCSVSRPVSVVKTLVSPSVEGKHRESKWPLHKPFFETGYEGWKCTWTDVPMEDLIKWCLWRAQILECVRDIELPPKWSNRDTGIDNNAMPMLKLRGYVASEMDGIAFTCIWKAMVMYANPKSIQIQSLLKAEVLLMRHRLRNGLHPDEYQPLLGKLLSGSVAFSSQHKHVFPWELLRKYNPEEPNWLRVNPESMGSVLHLVNKQTCFLIKGFTFFPSPLFHEVCATLLFVYIGKQAINMNDSTYSHSRASMLGGIQREESDRTSGFLKAIFKQTMKTMRSLGTDGQKGGMPPQKDMDIEQLIENAPPCMKALHSGFRKTQTMKEYPKRLRYLSFLSYCGASDISIDSHIESFNKQAPADTAAYKKDRKFLFATNKDKAVLFACKKSMSEYCPRKEQGCQIVDEVKGKITISIPSQFTMDALKKRKHVKIEQKSS